MTGTDKSMTRQNKVNKKQNLQPEKQATATGCVYIYNARQRLSKHRGINTSRQRETPETNERAGLGDKEQVKTGQDRGGANITST